MLPPVHPVLDEAGSRRVVVLVANCVRFAQARYQLLVVVAQLRKGADARPKGVSRSWQNEVGVLRHLSC
jgi:hypothetical protein